MQRRASDNIQPKDVRQEFVKFPRTPHLFLLPGCNIRDDKVMSPEEASEMLRQPVTVEEKVDGANIGIAFDGKQPRVWNRGNFLSPGAHPQFDPLWEWLYTKLHLLQPALKTRYVLFGEWCFLKHSIQYTNLPDWFLGFDLYDLERHNFLSTCLRNTLFNEMEIQSVPLVFAGKTTEKELLKMLHTQKSAFSDTPAEGFYIRQEDHECLIKRAKLVQAYFIQEIDEHWQKKKPVKNRLDNRKAS